VPPSTDDVAFAERPAGLTTSAATRRS
jgi:hypothetical protein